MKTTTMRSWPTLVLLAALGCATGAPKATPRMAAFPTFPGTSGGLSTVSTDGVTIQGDGSSGNKVAIKAIQTDATLTGAGTVASPVGANPAAALTPDFAGYFKAKFQQLTGLSPLQYSAYCEDFSQQSLGIGGGAQGAISSGTGAGWAWDNTLGGGVMTSTAPSSGGGYADWSTGGSLTNGNLGNVKTKHWMTVYRAAITHAPSAASNVWFGPTAGSTQMGLGYSAGQTTWHYVRGTGSVPTSLVDTGITITSTASPPAFFWMWLRSDTTNVKYCFDVVGGCTETTAEASSGLPSTVGGRAYLGNEGTASSDTIKLDAVCVFSQRD